MTQAQQDIILTSVKQVFTVIDRKVAMAFLDVGTTTISNAIRDNTMPASWWKVIKQLCQEQGKMCPDHLFKFKEVSSQ